MGRVAIGRLNPLLLSIANPHGLTALQPVAPNIGVAIA
jgi:hypothetical protein